MSWYIVSVSSTGMQQIQNLGRTFLKFKDLENIWVNSFIILVANTRLDTDP